jgi:uncharacterized protein
VSNFVATPFTVPVFDLIHRPGEMREKSLDARVEEGFGIAVIGIAEGATVHLEVRLESLHDGILVSADVDATATGECVRCLDSVEQPIEVEIQELFAYSVDEAFDYAVVDEHVDLLPLVRDAVVLALPFQPVCRPDCPGLDPETGERLADFPDRKPTEVIDPRWSALAGFQPDESDVAGTEANDADGIDREKRS